MSLIHNERTKLLANALDRASTASFTVGVLVPIVAASVELPGYGFGAPLAALSLRLVFGRVGPTLDRKARPRETPAMNTLLIYNYALPFIVMAAAGVIYWVTRDHNPA